MNSEECLKILINHQEWRRGGDKPPAYKPKDIGEAVDYAIQALTQEEAVASGAGKLSAAMTTDHELLSVIEDARAKAEYMRLNGLYRASEEWSEHADRLQSLLDGGDAGVSDDYVAAVCESYEFMEGDKLNATSLAIAIKAPLKPTGEV